MLNDTDVAFCSVQCADAFALCSGRPCALESCLNVVPDNSPAAFCCDDCVVEFAYAPF